MIPFTLPTVAKFTPEMADYQAISTKNLAVEHKPLHVPPKEEIAKSKPSKWVMFVVLSLKWLFNA